jgi:hypothetical protein
MRTVVLLVVTLLLVYGSEAFTQGKQVLSPRDSVFLSLDTNKISVNFSRPSMRGRVIMGQLVPWNKVWRTGANQATSIKTNFDMMLGDVPVPRGTYTLFTLPSPTGWKFIINKQTGQWGTQYDPGQDLARFDAKVETLPAVVDTLTFALDATGKTSGVMRLKWERTQVSAAFERNDRIRPLSPLDSAAISLAGKKIAVKYSKPYMRGRTIWGVVVPYDSLWRTGANLVTSLTTEADLMVNGTPIPHGSYTLYSIPAENGLTLIISKKPGGTSPIYDPTQDLARVKLGVDTVKTPIDPFRIWFDPATGNSSVLRLGWADRVYSTTVSLKN